MNGSAIVTSGGTLPTRYTMTGGGAFCNNTPLPIGLSGSQKGIYYQLQRDRGNGFVNVGTTVQGNGNAISLGNHSTLGEYRVVVNSACLTIMKGTISITACTARISAEEDPSGMTKQAFAQVMPNPVSNTMRLKVTDAKDQKVNVSLIDAVGRTMLQRSFVPESNQHQEEFNVSDITSGMYFLRVSADRKNATLKVVKVQ